MSVCLMWREEKETPQGWSETEIRTARESLRRTENWQEDHRFREALGSQGFPAFAPRENEGSPESTNHPWGDPQSSSAPPLPTWFLCHQTADNLSP